LAKVKSVFFCQSCGASSPKWLGRCPSCGEWNTYVEEKVSSGKSGAVRVSSPQVKPQPLGEIQAQTTKRLRTGNKEFDRVTGGGIVPGSLILLGGEPGIGKSTLSLQLALSLSGTKILYVSGEESQEQVKMRADRMKANNQDCLIYPETDNQRIIDQINELNPQLVIIDSIQTLQSDVIESAPGSIAQIRECAGQLMKLAKTTGISILLIGHINKDGAIAGPKVLEHMVDTVLQFEGDRNHIYRLLRTTKNRFGSTHEMGIFEMRSDGLTEVDNPSDILISHHNSELSGIAIAASMEGLRPLLIETQALVSSAVYGTPQRSATGFDLRRLSMLLAVLEKRCGFRLGAKDVFLNMAGGIKVDDPAIDLAVVCAVLSSSEDIPIGNDVVFAGEVGLSGEIRPVNRLDQRIKESEKLGFEQIVVSAFAMKGISQKDFKIEIIPVKKIDEVFTRFFA
jgi:DNA repair protein RadA/Sms